MSQSSDSWSAASNDALTVSLVAPASTGTKTIASFKPKFTYPIFGDEEQIFGYQGLDINLKYNASDMRPHLAISYLKKFKAVGDTEPTNIEEMVKQFLPPVAFQKEKDFEAAAKQSSTTSWTPPGELASTYTAKDGTYEIWKGNLASPAIKQLVARLQILVSLFVEGGRPIDLEEQDLDRWTVYFLYRKTPVREGDQSSPYVFAGYCTVYRFFLYQPPATPPASPVGDGSPSSKDDLELGDGNFDLSTLPCRSRISQFIIVPPFQGKGHGPRLYGSIFKDYLEHPQTMEITVEDPNEAFDDLRDLSDLAFLRTVPEFTALKINTDVKLPKEGGAVPRDLVVGPEAVDAVRRGAKMAPRQFVRVLEMHLMSELADSVRPGINPEAVAAAVTAAAPSGTEAHEYRLWKLLVKTRLYRQNRDTLGQMEPSERVEKLRETVGSVEFEYARLLAMHEARAQTTKTVSTENGEKESATGKRKLEDGEGARESKKARVEDA